MGPPTFGTLDGKQELTEAGVCREAGMREIGEGTMLEGISTRKSRHGQRLIYLVNTGSVHQACHLPNRWWRHTGACTQGPKGKPLRWSGFADVTEICTANNKMQVRTPCQITLVQELDCIHTSLINVKNATHELQHLWGLVVSCGEPLTWSLSWLFLLFE